MALLLIVARGRRKDRRMKHILLSLIVLFVASAAPAQAACYADYKAKQDNPLRLHYGVIEITGPCSRGAAAGEAAARLARGGWVLLNVVSVFGPEGLAERRDSAGSYYLRF
jgi:hypothetical protein